MMRQALIGGIAAILLLVGGFFLWQGTSAGVDPLPRAVGAPPPEALPEGAEGLVGAAPPEVPRARAGSREERRFARYDRNRDGTITRVEMLSTRTNAFRRLDTDHNNLLSFEEWAAATGNRFTTADADRSGTLTPSEFATTAPRRNASPRCACPPASSRRDSGGNSDS
jgi:hypothetical protein